MPVKSRFEERKAILDSEMRTCRVCSLTKQLNLEFRYISLADRYHTYCKDCENLRKRLKYSNLPIPTEFDILKKRVRKKLVFENKPYRRTSYYNRKRLDYKAIDKKKGQISDLTIEFIQNAFNSRCVYCDYPAITLDRIDNDKGHIMNNCVSACYECNTARNRTFSYEEMLILGKVIKEIKDKRINYISSKEIFPRYKTIDHVC